jgi:predicted dehydrogenase
MNQAPHTVDQFVWIGGMPKSVQAIATTRLHQIEVENTALAIFDYGEGKVGSLYASTAEASTGETLEVVGDKGALIWKDGKLRRLRVSVPISHHLREGEKWGAPETSWEDVEYSNDYDQLHKGLHQQFARAVATGDASLVVASGEDGVRELEVANAILMAGYTRREVQFPLDAAAFDTMLEKLQSGTRPDELRVS